MGCITPYRLNANQPDERDVPCGKCPGCRRQRVNSWAFRLGQEEKRHDSALFVTLTYSNDNLIYDIASHRATLYKRHLQLFFKRLRKSTKCRTIRYYACGEYGSRYKRPHYHAIIFDATATQICEAWGYGSIHTDCVNDNTIAYTLKYMCKPPTIRPHMGDTLAPEFSLMSKRMGSNYISDATVRWHLGGLTQKRNYLVLPGGYKQTLPRYYRDVIFYKSEREELCFQANQSRLAKTMELMLEYATPMDYENARKEAVKTAMRNYHLGIGNKRETF